MTGEMERRLPSDMELGYLRGAVQELEWTSALKLAGLDHHNPPFHPNDQDLSDDQRRAARLATLAVGEHLRRLVEEGMDGDVRSALYYGASFSEIGDALGISRQAAEQRFRHVRLGDRVAVVISRRDRVRMYPEDPRGRVGEVGGKDQYDIDRGIWPIGQKVRAEARYAIVAVDSAVRRVYELDPNGWREAEPNKWEFTAVGGHEMTPEQIEAAFAAGDLPMRPGDDCPTRAGGAYRPHWF
ncbi:MULTISPECIES: hypothetical protein [unclassified Kitasatospora]|uniref:hypothetical protein n=1 Tax=unclassified Kitasatospora TaxID=2633591 RepID=UPI0033C5995C